MATINITGTGGIIEGNLGTADVNVNLDSALDFDGVDDYVEGDDAGLPSGSAARSISMWIKPDAITQAYGCPFSYGTKSSSNGFAITWNNTTANFLIGKFGANSSGGSNSGANNSTIPMNAWSHFVVTVDGSGNIAYYLNGVADGTATLSGINTTLDVYRVGDVLNAWGTQNFDGTIADVKVFSDVLTATEAQELSQKINYDISIGSIDNMSLWLKLNEGTGNPADHENNGTDYDGVNYGATWTFDEYSVDVYDGLASAGGTTTDGTFEISKGKVEGLSLTTGEFDGDDDFVELGSQSGDLRLNGGKATISAWVRIVDVSADDGYKRIIDKSDGGASANGYALWINTDGIVSLDVNGVAQHATQAGVITDATWHHVVGIIDTTNGATIYVDGVEQTGGATIGGTTTVPTTTTNARIGSWNHSTGREFKGKIRDFKVFDYALSAEQAASLYSGTYPQTALHYWKLNEGSGTAATDSGTSSTLVNGVMTNGATYTNGTLDLDGTLTIAANGTLSAPRGELEIQGTTGVNRAGSFIHNNGTVDFTSASTTIQGTTMTGSNAFYIIKSTGNTWYRIDQDIDIERHALSGYVFWFYGNVTVTMGTDTYSSGTDNSNKCIGWTYVYGHTSSTYKLYAKNELYPWLYDYANVGNSSWINGSQDARMGIAHLKGGNIIGDFSIAETTNPKSIVLDGDMEFDGVTVGNTNTLDLSGQRMYASGLLTISGDNGLKNTTDGSTQDTVAHLIPNGIIASTTTHHASLSNVVYIADQGTSSHKIEYFDFGTFASTRDGNLGFGRYGPDSSSTNVILANNGTMTNWGRTGSVANANSMNNLTIATGATAVPESATLTVAGDFTTSGGLIGTSALVFDGTDDIAHIPDNAAISGLTNMSVEVWAKYPSSGVSTYSYIIRKNAEYQLGIDNNGYFYGIFHDGTAERDFVGNVDYRDGKWHHFAGTWDSTSGTGKFYVDGKLIGTSSGNAVPINNHGGVVSIGGRDADGTCSSFFKGSMDEIRIWNDVRTESEIRAGMFGTYSSSEAGLAGRWACDEGTGTTVADSSSNSNTLTFGAATGGTGGAGANPPSWAGAGTFTMGTSTLDFTGNGEWAISDYTTDYYNVKVAASGKTTTIRSVGGSERRPRINNLLTHGGGTLTDINNADITFHGTGTHTAGADLSGLYITYWPSSTDIPGGTYQYLITQHNDLSCTANINCGGYFAVSSDDGFNLKTHTLTTGRMILYANSTFSMGAGSLIFDSTSGLTGDYTGRTFTAGPGATISGVTAKSGFFSENNYSIVGDISNLDVSNEELTVIGTVSNCTGDILQFTPGHDTSLSLETDTAEDRDIRLGGPSLDNANHLIPE